MAKKGMALETVVTAILALIVLVVLAYVFRDQIGNAAGSIFKIGKEGEEGATGKRCITLVTSTSRKCGDDCSKLEGTWREVFPSGDKFEDCLAKHCCERVDSGEENEKEDKGKEEKK